MHESKSYLIILVGFISITSALECLSCQSAEHLRECENSVITCNSQNENCFLDITILSNLTKVYTAGCRKIQICNMMGSLSGRRSVVGCAQCCDNPPYNDGMPCNGHLCRQHLTNIQQSTTPRGTNDCVDLTNCRQYLRERICPKTSTYRPWAEAHCKVYCGICDPHTPIPPCKNEITNCNEYGSDLCTNPLYRLFREDNCSEFCGLCVTAKVTTEPVHTTTTSPTAKTSTTTGRETTEYPPFIQVPSCENYISNCDAYGDNLCISQMFMLFRERNCRKYCGLCADLIGFPYLTSVNNHKHNYRNVD